jgi:hypothetical protein
MPEDLYWETVSDTLKDVLVELMETPLFNDFRLVGRTALSIQFGHRKSDDIDLFTDPHTDLFHSIKLMHF